MCTGLRSTSCVSRWALVSWDVWVGHRKWPSFLKREGDNASEIRVKKQDSPCHSQICDVWRPPRGWGQVMSMEQWWQLEQIVSMLMSDHSCSHNPSTCTVQWHGNPAQRSFTWHSLSKTFLFIFSPCPGVAICIWKALLYTEANLIGWNTPLARETW